MSLRFFKIERKEQILINLNKDDLYINQINHFPKI